MKYRKNEAKEYAKKTLHGVWTALPTVFTRDDRVDDAANASNLEHCISKLGLAGHYCLGNVGEFWAMTNEERMRVMDINVETAKGRVPLIAGCHHQNPYEAITLARHAQSIGIDFVIILTPYMAARNDDAVFEYFKLVCERVDIGVVLFNTEQTYPLSTRLAKRLAALPNICGFKQGISKPAAATALRDGVGKEMEVSVADEAPFVYNVAVCGDRWLLNYCPHLYQVPGYTPVNDYYKAAVTGDMNKAIELARSLNPLRSALAKWVPGYGGAGRMAIAEQKFWMECIGMAGGPVRAPCSEMTDEAKKEMRADLEATGLVAKAKAGLGKVERRAA
ncbi:MAG TPA: dihydrodipicolinate synthase family protein [Burkholderiales bacterium]|nr:dihydrodipicolinate synthase family protein [Burkholderiales bacterium]